MYSLSAYGAFEAQLSIGQCSAEIRWGGGGWSYIIIIIIKNNNNNNNNIIYSIYRALIPYGPKALYIIKITTKS